MSVEKYIEKELLEKYEFHNYNHALEILTQAFADDWNELLDCLKAFSITTDDIRQAGGNETNIPKKIDEYLRPLQWEEIKISGDLHVKIFPRRGKKGTFAKTAAETRIIEGYIDGHNIDYVKGKVAFDLEWNSKDQTYDRDLLAMRTYYDCGIISVGIILTRAEDLDEVFKSVYSYDKKTGEWKPCITKYGASTTWMGKLIPRLDSKRNGGCPILAIGIRNKCVSDWKEGYEDEHKS